MRWQIVVLWLSATLGGTFLADQALSVRYAFPAGSLWRSFFFDFWINAGALFSSFPAIYAYVSGFKTWSTTQRVVLGAVTLIPVSWTLWFVAAVIMFARTE
jgi:hypothetical protein